MTAERHMHRDLQGISPELFPLWNETLGYERGLPLFRQPPSFSEEGTLELATGEYTCHRRRRMTPPQAGSQLSPSPIEEIEHENGSPPMELPLSQDEYEGGDPNYLAPDQWQQTALAPIQPSAAGPTTTLPEEYNTFLEADPLYENPTEGNEQLYPPSIFMSSMNTTPGSTSAPTQLDPNSPASPYGQAQDSLGHNEPMTPFQMEDLSVLVSNSTSPTILTYDSNDTNNAIEGHPWHA